jgi:endonuclease VIII
MWTEAEIRRVILDHAQAHTAISSRSDPHADRTDVNAPSGSLSVTRHNEAVPEGDTVWRACQRLNEVLAGRELTRSEFRVPSLAATDLTGVAVDEVISRGKHQLFRFSNEFTLHAHFRMDGVWKIYPRGRRWSGGPAFEIRAVLGTDDHDVVGYRLPVLELVPTAAEDTVVGHLGPDLLGCDWNPDEAVTRIAAQPDRTIGEALLDQQNLAGLGAFYRAELLFLQGVHPRTPVGQVRDLYRMVDRGHQLLMANRWRAEQSTTGDLRRGRRAYVYQRSGQPCRRCGTPIRTDELGPRGEERHSYWCPHCQPGP